MRKLMVPILAVALVMVAAPRSMAQVDFGAQLSWGDDTDLGLGVRATTSLDDWIEGLTGVGSFVLFFPDEPAGTDLSFWEINFDGHYPIALEAASSMKPYFGGGINIVHSSISRPVDRSDTDVGLNFLLGANFESSGSITPFVEIKLELSGGEQFVISGGVYF